jgi:ankyrin repeat protein
MFTETLQEILVKAPTAMAARSALTVLVGLAQDTDFDALRSLSQALASELGYDPDTNGVRRAQSIDEFLNAPDIPPVLRIYGAGFWPQRLLNTPALSKQLGDVLMCEDGFRGFQLLVQREAPVQHELLKAYILGAFVNMLNSNVMSGLVSSGGLLHILDQIRAQGRVVPGTNADASFNFGRELILRAPRLSSFYSVVYHELGHHVLEAARGGFQSGNPFPSPEAGAEVAGQLPILLERARQLKGKPIAPGDPRRYQTSTGVTLLCTYAEMAGGPYTQLSVMNSAGPIELRPGAAWGYFILSLIGADVTHTAAAYSPRGVFHFGFPGHGLETAVLRQRLQALDLPQLLPALEAGSSQWLDELARTSRMGQTETDVPTLLGVLPRQAKFYGLHPKIVWNDLQVCQQLREDPRKAVEAPDEIKNGLLGLAVRCGDPAAVRNLLAAGASARARLPDGFGCINQLGHSLCVVHDQNGKSYYGPTAASLLEVIAVLTSAGLNLNEPSDAAGNTLLHGAAGRNVELTQFFLSQGAKVDTANLEGRTPLFEAVAYGPLPAVQALLDAGAEVARKDNRGTTPLHRAVERGEEQTVLVLLRRGAPVDAPASDGQTALMLAAILGQAGLVKLLLENGACVEAANSLGQTALHFAVSSFSQEAQPALMEALLGAGADIDEEANDGTTVLMLAASRGNVDSVEFLLARQPNLNATDTDGNTALILALKSSAGTRADFIRKLLSHGADPLHANATGETPQTLTQDESHKAVNRIITEAAGKVKPKS